MRLSSRHVIIRKICRSRDLISRTESCQGVGIDRQVAHGSTNCSISFTSSSSSPDPRLKKHIDGESPEGKLVVNQIQYVEWELPKHPLVLMWLVERRARGLQPASEAVLLQKLAEGGDNIT